MQKHCKMAKPGVFLALFPPEHRGRVLGDVLAGKQTPERYLLYGMDALIKSGIPLETNLYSKKIHDEFVRQSICMLYKSLAKKLLGAHGNIEWLLPVWSKIRNASFIYAFSERSIYPILVFRSIGLLPRISTIVISIGIAEKLQALITRCKTRELKWLLWELKSLSRIITFSNLEEEILKKKFGLSNVSFVPLGVDVTYFRQRYNMHPIDVLGVGADKNRDFKIFIEVARRLQRVNFRLITNKHHAGRLTRIGIPRNVAMKVNVSLEDVAKDYARSKIVFLPIRENTYSGATTCLLQAMASARPVITNRAGATKSGYQFVHNRNLVYVEMGDAEAAANQIARLLEDGNTRQDIGRKARELVEKNFTLDSMNQSILLKIQDAYRKAYGVELPCGK